MRSAFAAVVSTIAIGSFIADLWFLQFLGAVVAPIALPLLPFSIVGALLVFRRAGGPIGWLLGTAGALFRRQGPQDRRVADQQKGVEVVQGSDGLREWTGRVQSEGGHKPGAQ